MRRFIPRAIGPELKAAARDFPVLALTGPRQTGKSTLLRRLFPSHSYATLDDPLTRACGGRHQGLHAGGAEPHHR